MAEEKGLNLDKQAGASQAGPQGRNFLLAIAIDEYVHCSKLNNCVKDARDFITILVNNYQFELENTITLFNSEATRSSISRTFQELKTKVKPQDNLVVYFSGHGETVDDIGYWVPVEAHPGADWEFLSTAEIKNRLDVVNSFHTFLVVDACFSGSLFTTYRSVNVGYESKRSRWGLAASHSRERALDGTPGENSPFAATLLRRLRENQSNLGVQKLAADIIDEVHITSKGRQTPVFKPLDVKGDDSGQYVFRIKADEAREWTICQKADSIAAYQAFIAKYPDSPHAPGARSILEVLQEEEAWQVAKAAKSMRALIDFERQFPESRRSEVHIEITQVEEETLWQKATRSNTVTAYREYSFRSQLNKYRKEAEDAITLLLRKEDEQDDWQQAKKQGSQSAYETYLRQYPDGVYVSEAQAAIQEIKQQIGQKEQEKLEAARLAKAAEEKQQREAAERQKKEEERLRQKAPAPQQERMAAYNGYKGKRIVASNWTQEQVDRHRTRPGYIGIKWVKIIEEDTKEPVGVIKKKEDAASLQKAAEEKQRQEETETKHRALDPFQDLMIPIKGGAFQMGDENNIPVHEVKLKDFHLCKHPVTQAQWRAVMGSDPPGLYYSGWDDCPVQGVSWDEVQAFLKKLNEKTGRGYRLPTEAEWEYAARDGNALSMLEFAGSDNVDEVAWYEGNCDDIPQPVMAKKANKLGLYDMSGNVFEWCSDWYGPYSAGAQINPKGPDSGEFRILRGGSWCSNDYSCRVVNRYNFNPVNGYDDIGFRLAQD